MKLSSNPFLMFRDFTWRRIGKEEERKNFPYLSTLSRNIRNGFELRISTVFDMTQVRPRKSRLCIKTSKNVAMNHLKVIGDKWKIRWIERIDCKSQPSKIGGSCLC